MKELILNLIRLQAIAYYNNTVDHNDVCYREVEDILKRDTFNACNRKQCTHVKFCLALNNILNQLDEVK